MPSRDESHVTSTAARFTTLRFACLGASRHCAATGDVLTQPRQDARPLCVANRLGMAREDRLTSERSTRGRIYSTVSLRCWWRCRSPDPRRETCPSVPRPVFAEQPLGSVAACCVACARAEVLRETPHTTCRTQSTAKRSSIDRQWVGRHPRSVMHSSPLDVLVQQSSRRAPASLLRYTYSMPTPTPLCGDPRSVPQDNHVSHIPPPLVSFLLHGVQFCCAALPVRFLSGKHFGDDAGTGRSPFVVPAPHACKPPTRSPQVYT